MSSAEPIAADKTRWNITTLGLIGGLLVYLSLLFGSVIFSHLAVYDIAGKRNMENWQTISVVVGLAAPLAGLFADKVGRRKVMIGAALLVVPTSVMPLLATDPLLVEIGQVGSAVAWTFFYPAMIAYLFEVTWSRRFLASVMALYVGVQVIFNGAGQTLTSLFAVFRAVTPPSPWIALGVASIALFGVGTGAILVARAHHLRRQYCWPEEWVQPDRRRFWIVLVSQIVLLRFLAELASTAANDRFFKFIVGTMDRLSFYSVMLLLTTLVGLVALASGPVADWFDWYLARTHQRTGGHLIVLGVGLLLLSLGSLLLLSPQGPLDAAATALVVGELGADLAGPLFAAMLAARARPRYWGLAAGASIGAGTLGQMVGHSSANGIVLGAVVVAMLIWAAAMAMNWSQRVPDENQPGTVAELLKLG